MSDYEIDLRGWIFRESEAEMPYEGEFIGE